jgi:hypothetical protein
MRKQPPAEGQASLFEPRPPVREARPKAAAQAAATAPSGRKWTMPVAEGRTVAEIRLRWTKRLTPAQVGRVEAELSALPQALTKLGFGAVQVENVFVRRRKT